MLTWSTTCIQSPATVMADPGHHTAARAAAYHSAPGTVSSHSAGTGPNMRNTGIGGSVAQSIHTFDQPTRQPARHGTGKQEPSMDKTACASQVTSGKEFAPNQKPSSMAKRSMMIGASPLRMVVGVLDPRQQHAIDLQLQEYARRAHLQPAHCRFSSRLTCMRMLALPNPMHQGIFCRIAHA